MRRKDREVTDFNKINDIIEKCYCCRIGLYDEEGISIVPMNFGYQYKNHQWIFYFHSASEGHKIELMKANPQVGFELDTSYALKEGKTACDYSSYYQSIIGKGKIVFITDAQEKNLAMNSIMQHYTKKKDWTYHEKIFQEIYLVNLIVTDITCKEHQ